MTAVIAGSMAIGVEWPGRRAAQPIPGAPSTAGRTDSGSPPALLEPGQAVGHQREARERNSRA
ncbi:hypothetical protein AB4Z10_07835 [Bosea sp. RAF48]|uniref:hypothetical protein n=1 Tax=Bosea sp. RAF48 TaxID=3237480 RepID=UPI003F90A3E9